MPVIYVFGKKNIDIDDSVAQLSRIVEERLASNSLKKFVLVKTDVAYAHVVGMLLDVRFTRFGLGITYYLLERVQAALQAKLPSTRVVAPSLHKSYTPPPNAVRNAPSAPADPNQPSESLSSPTATTNQSSSIDTTVKQPDEYSVEESIILYIGGESLALTNFLLTHAQSEVCVFRIPCDYN